MNEKLLGTQYVIFSLIIPRTPTHERLRGGFTKLLWFLTRVSNPSSIWWSDGYVTNELSERQTDRHTDTLDKEFRHDTGLTLLLADQGN